MDQMVLSGSPSTPIQRDPGAVQTFANSPNASAV
jgi:hypothetical protein